MGIDINNVRRVGLVIKPNAKRAIELAVTLTNYLLERFDEVIVDETVAREVGDERITAVTKERLGGACELAIVLGGDGTFLSAARAMARNRVPIIGINLGHLGFLAEVPPENMTDQLDLILNGDRHLEERTIVSVTYRRAGKTLGRDDACNDLTLKHKDSVRMIEVDTSIDGVFLNTVWSDGLIVSTPTGSTGYALSSGGPIIEPTLDALLLVPICPHTLSYRPLIVQPDKSIEIRYTLNNNDAGLASIDGQVNQVLEPGDTVVVETSPYKLQLIQPSNHDYLRTLRTKLRWSERL